MEEAEARNYQGMYESYQSWHHLFKRRITDLDHLVKQMTKDMISSKVPADVYLPFLQNEFNLIVGRLAVAPDPKEDGDKHVTQKKVRQRESYTHGDIMYNIQQMDIGGRHHDSKNG